MQRLKLSDWASVAEIFGTIAVVVSLLIVAFSLERNTRAVSGQSADVITSAMREIDTSLLNDPELLMISIKGGEDPYSLTGLQFARYQQWVVMNLGVWEQLLARQGYGLLQNEAVVGWDEYFVEWTGRHVTRELWEDIAWNFPAVTSGYFQSRVEAALPDAAPQ